MIGLAEFSVSLLFNAASARQGISRMPLSSPSSQAAAPQVAFGQTPLKALLRGIGVKSKRAVPGDAAITCLITDSRRVVPGALFFAIPGTRADGNLFIEEAIDRGAAAIVSEQAGGAHVPVPYFQVENARLALAVIAKRFYGEPDEALSVIGVTGTNGKTTVTLLVQHLLGGRDEVGLLGTIRYDLGRRTLPSFRTTPDSVDTFAMLDQMRRGGCRSAALEVSSHGLVQHRVHGVNFGTVAFLNLTQDHLDYHGTLENYFAAKSRLFNGENGTVPRAAVVCADDPYGPKIAELCKGRVPVTTFGVSAEADLRAENIELSLDGSSFELVYRGERYPAATPLLGEYNVRNVLAAIAIALAEGRDLADVLTKVRWFSGVPGRMERVANQRGLTVLVDYAHTDDALRLAHQMLRKTASARILTVFGCGGDRDRTKRPRMAAAVEEGADRLFITSDNPRREALETIFDDMRAGLKRPGEAVFIAERRDAIAAAIDAAEPGDVVLIAGKGHETYQEIHGSILPFDDRQVAAELLNSAGDGPEHG